MLSCAKKSVGAAWSPFENAGLLMLGIKSEYPATLLAKISLFIFMRFMGARRAHKLARMRLEGEGDHTYNRSLISCRCNIRLFKKMNSVWHVKLANIYAAPAAYPNPGGQILAVFVPVRGHGEAGHKLCYLCSESVGICSNAVIAACAVIYVHERGAVLLLAGCDRERIEQHKRRPQ